MQRPRKSMPRSRKLLSHDDQLIPGRLPGFDAEYYLRSNPDVRAAGVDPLRHYLTDGWQEGRDPSPGFKTIAYLDANPDVRETNQNPLLHYLNFGLAEGRLWQRDGLLAPSEGENAPTTQAAVRPPASGLDATTSSAAAIGDKDLWGARAKENLDLPPHGWLDVEWLLRSRVWPKVFGSVPRGWWAPEVFQGLGVRTGGKWLSLGCGGGHAEIALAQYGTADEVLGLDPSAGAIAVASERAFAAGVADRVAFAVSAMDFPQLVPNSVDVVQMTMALHHIHDLEWVLAQVFTALRPGGCLVANEFVGPRRFQWSDARLARVRAFLASLPDHLRRDYRDDAIKSDQETHPAEWWAAHDPTESVRSDDILPLIKEICPSAEIRPYGGNIANLVLENIVHNLDPSRDEDRRWMEKLWSEDDASVAAEGSDFVYIVARKSDDCREMSAAWEVASRWLKGQQSPGIHSREIVPRAY